MFQSSLFLFLRQISSRGDTCLALTECGRVFAWGNNEYGQIWPIIDQVQVLEPIELPIRKCLSDVQLGKITKVAAAGSMCAILDEHGHVSQAILNHNVTMCKTWYYASFSLGFRMGIRLSRSGSTNASSYEAISNSSTIILTCITILKQQNCRCSARFASFHSPV